MEYEGVWCHEVASGDVCRRWTRRNGGSIAQQLRNTKQVFEWLGKMLDCV